MRPRYKLGTTLCAAALALCASPRAARGRQGEGEAQAAGEVLRVNAELVQTGVTVFDKDGRFVDGLRREDFELRAAVGRIGRMPYAVSDYGANPGSPTSVKGPGRRPRAGRADSEGGAPSQPPAARRRTGGRRTVRGGGAKPSQLREG